MSLGLRPRIGIFGVGLAAYWPQFPGLKDRLTGYQGEVEDRLRALDADLVTAGLVDDTSAAGAAARLFAANDVDLVVCYVGTYATSSQVLPAVQRLNVPVLVLNLQPVEALDYERTDTQEWLANCSTCCVPEVSNAFVRARIPFHVVSGTLRGEAAWRELEQWVKAARAARGLRLARVGFLGHTYPGMLDLYSDFTAVTAQLGTHIEVLEMDDLAKLVENVSPAELESKRTEARSVFELAPNVEPEDLDWASRVAVGLDHLTSKFQLDALTYYYRGVDGNEMEQLGAGLILGNSMLTARGIPASGEGDLKTNLAMLLLDRLGAGGSFTEFYAMDFKERFVLMGHDGPGHVAISARKPILRRLGLFHGKRGYGLSVEFSVRLGPVTILGVTQDAEGRLRMIAAEGESLPGPILKIGNTNSRLRFALPPAEFVNAWCQHGPTHHCALGVGHRLGELRKLAAILKLDLHAVA
ncbi:L-fucose/L-arabinose isomerase family protein [uncultured Paludibaculum sp.]|uniref:L-fucose/L-arabinose isomerase family protein n=1 Tax=uncultured Paludibaculum sp. TaxID=1765020 RepID=UPI002AAAC78A|nr:L-fucose/L-arabinose isomerase family protein [uncultured Paludibaculum sp.]